MVGLGLALLVAGSATFYAPGVMEDVYANRLAWGHVQPCAACVGMVALMDRDTIGQLVYLQRDGLDPEGPFLVVDCANAAHLAALRARNRVVEVDFETAQRWGMQGPIPVRVLQLVTPPAPGDDTPLYQSGALGVRERRAPLRCAG
jgi:hypothetical protein